MKKALLVLAIALAVIGVALLGALHYASRTIEDTVLEALGAESQVGEVKVRLKDVELLDIRVGAPKGWPAETALRAARVVLTPKLSQLFSDRIELTDVTIEDAYISAARPKEGGGLRVMPGLARKTQKTEEGRRGADIRVVHLSNCTVDIYDASVAVKPQRMRLESVSGTVKDVQVPGLGARTDIDLTGQLPGPAHRGKISVRGWVDVAKKSSELTAQVRGADLASFEPYIAQKLKAGIDSGTFDVQLKSTVRNNALNAAGTLTIHSLKLRQSDSPLEALAEIPRRAALGAVTDKDERITVEFTLEGDLDDPTFSLAGAGALKTGLALIKAFGLSFEGLVRAIWLIINGFGASLGAALS
jgi:uncharacterized protein involved in outer membrane biogenesis